MPDGFKRAGSHTACGHQLIELRQVFFLLRQNLAEHRAVCGFSQHGQLALVDSFGTVFARLIDTNHLRQLLFAAELTGQGC